MSKASSKSKAPRKGAYLPRGSGEASRWQEGALSAPQSPVHSRARAKLDAVCERLAGGTPINHACALEGVPRQSFYELIASDEGAALVVAAARAKGAEAYRSSLVLIAEGNGAERANANVLLHLMERLYPDDYAPPKQRVEQTGADGGAQEIKHSGEIVVDLSGAMRIARNGESK
jgi:hypothetical protein